MIDAGTPHVPVSWGELIDKITILEIKQERIPAGDARANVVREYLALRTIADAAIRTDEIMPLIEDLKTVNSALWEIEDAIRDQEARAQFGADFVRLARSVYIQNDRRTALKRAINVRLNSELIEEKSYNGAGCHRSPGSG